MLTSSSVFCVASSFSCVLQPAQCFQSEKFCGRKGRIGCNFDKHVSAFIWLCILVSLVVSFQLKFKQALSWLAIWRTNVTPRDEFEHFFFFLRNTWKQCTLRYSLSKIFVGKCAASPFSYLMKYKCIFENKVTLVTLKVKFYNISQISMPSQMA